MLVKQALKRCVNKNILVQVKGTGASGSFKVNKEIKNINKVRRERDREREKRNLHVIWRLVI